MPFSYFLSHWYILPADALDKRCSSHPVARVSLSIWHDSYHMLIVQSWWTDITPCRLRNTRKKRNDRMDNSWMFRQHWLRMKRAMIWQTSLSAWNCSAQHICLNASIDFVIYLARVAWNVDEHLDALNSTILSFLHIEFLCYLTPLQRVMKCF